MKKKVLIITEKYYPLTGANTVCCKNIADYLLKNNCAVDVISIKQSYDELVEDVDGVRVKKLNTFKEDLIEKYNKKHKISTWEELPKYLRVFYDFLSKIKYFFATKTQRRYLDTLNYKKIFRDVKSTWGTYDCIISTCAPFSLVVMGKKLTQMGLAKKHITILLDTYVHDAFLSSNPKKLKKRKKIAEKTLANSDKIFALEGVLSGNLSKGYNPDYHKKLVEIYPITLREQTNLQRENDKINLVYTGRFYNVIRSPEKMLDILSNLPKEFVLNLYSHGCQEIVDSKIPLFKENQIIMHGNVTHKECLQAIGKSNILVNLGNTISNQMPSKVLEYMGFGKPIINFYQNPDDMGLKMFNNYPLSFNLNLNDYTQKDVEELIKFCIKHSNTILDYETATKNLTEYKSETICNKILLEILK